MQLRHMQTILQAGNKPGKVMAVAWAPNNLKLAVVTTDRVVHLYDETGEKRDKFSTKPGDSKGTKSYLVMGMAFSPDSTRLAIAQSDNIVFVYKLGDDWGDKKSICNKFVQTCPVTSLIWPSSQPNLLVFGVAEGKVRVGNLKSNKSQTLYNSESYPISLTVNPAGTAIASGHSDGSINRFYFDDGVSGASQSSLTKHSCPPYALAWGQETILAAGADQRLVFYDQNGRIAQQYDYSREEGDSSFTVAATSPSGQSIVVGSFNKLRVFNYSPKRKAWDEAGSKVVENMYTCTAFGWKCDGSRLVVGSLCGAADVFDCCLRRSKYKGKFEFTYVGPSQVIVKRLSTGTRIVLKSHYGYEITKVNVFQDQFLIAHTSDTLLMGDLSSCRLSEVEWRGSGNEKFFFENSNVCMIYNAGELSLVEYGVNQVLGAVRTEHMNPHLVSVRLNERNRRNEDGDNKKIAYLIDLCTLRILDLVLGQTLASINHDSRIDWLELNGSGRKLLFRDKRRSLHLFDIGTQTRVMLQNYVTYVQWVPDSDVVVAQNRNNLCIWYSIDTPDRVSLFSIKGDVEDIERVDGRTEVVVNEGVNTVSYTLDEGLIEFGTAIEDGDYLRAVAFLETLEMTNEAEAMWRTLSNLALEDVELSIAERCFAALGDVSRSRYLRQLNDAIIKESEEERDGRDHYLVRAKIAALHKQFRTAESVFIEQGLVDDAIEMYQKLHQWDRAIEVATMMGHPELQNLKKNYSQWLKDTHQEEKAGELKEKDHDYVGAVGFYLKAGLPGRAAQLASQHEELYSKTDVLERIASALLKGGMYKRAGELFEKLRMNQRALDCYRKGHAYRNAVDLCRSTQPNEVVPLEEEWGDFLVKQKQLDSAIHHFIEAGCATKAVEAAISSRQWTKAVHIVDMLEAQHARKYFKVFAKHFDEAGQIEQAEKYYIKAGLPRDAINMYTRHNKWEAAHNLALTCMSRDEVATLYITQAQEMKIHGRFRDAEKLYVTIEEPDLAITMYKKTRQFDQMIRLVSFYHTDLLIETHLHLAKELENEEQHRQAEAHYIAGEEWKAAVNMYRNAGFWEDAHRVAKAHGGANAAKQVAYLWAKSLGGDSSVKLLTKFGLLDAAIDYAAENNHFDFAFELARSAAKEKVPAVSLKYAMFLEDEGRFREAEEEFIKAGKAREAVLMFVHNQQWDDAQRVAEQYDPGSVADVLVGQARLAFERKEYPRCETFLLRAQKPELAVKYYRDADMWEDALRVTKEYLPHKLPDIHEQYERHINHKGGKQGQSLLEPARMWESQGEYSRAIDAYLKVTLTHSVDLDFLQQTWEKAAELAVKFIPERSVDVVTMCCSRLLEIKRFEAAADLFISVEMIQEAINAYVAGHVWEKARRCAAEMAPKLASYVEDAYARYLKHSGDADRLVGVDVIAALDMYVKRGEWQKCLEAAETHKNRDVLNKYVALYAGHLLSEDQDVKKALQILGKYGAPANSQNFNIYRRLAYEVLKLDADYQTLADLRDMMYSLMENIENSDSNIDQNILNDFDKLLLVSHYAAFRAACSDHELLVNVIAKISIALLRYTDIIPADKAFVEAGEACRAASWEGMAFIFFNRYLDLADAIEEQSLDMLDNTDLVDTDIPFEVPLPEKPYYGDDKKEEYKEWVLAVSMDRKVEPELRMRRTEEGTEVYEATLIDPQTHTTYHPCVVTGYPVLRNKVEFKKSGKYANKEDWNKFIMATKVSHSNALQDVLGFLAQWCGSPSNPAYNFK